MEPRPKPPWTPEQATGCVVGAMIFGLILLGCVLGLAANQLWRILL